MYKSHPYINVIVPFKNGHRFLPNLLSTITRQTLLPQRLIIVDDNSHNQIEVNDLLFPELIRLDIVKSRGNGVSAARNTGLDLVTHGYVAFLDCDDYWDERKLETQIQQMVDFGVEMSCVGYRQIGIDGKVIQERSLEDRWLELSKVISGEQVVLGSASGVVMSHQLILQVGHFDESLEIGEDFDYWLRAMCVAKVLVVPEILVNILRHPGSTQDSMERSHRTSVEFESIARVLSKIEGFEEQKFFRLSGLMLLALSQNSHNPLKALNVRTFSLFKSAMHGRMNPNWIFHLGKRVYKILFRRLINIAKNHLQAKNMESEFYNLALIENYAVSIIVPTNRLDENLKLSLASSLRSLELVEGELVLVLDQVALDDATAYLSLFVKDLRLKLVVSYGRGIVDALNTGILHATNELIARMDGDDIMYPLRLHKQVERFRSDKNLVLLGGDIDLIDETGKLIRRIRYPRGNKNLQKMLVQGSFFAHPAVMYRKSVVMEVGLYSMQYPHAEDFALWVKLAQKGKIDNLNDSLIQYRTHANQVSNRFRDIQETSTIQIIEMQKKLQKPPRFYKRFLLHFFIRSIGLGQGAKGKILRRVWRLSLRLLAHPVTTIRRISQYVRESYQRET